MKKTISINLGRMVFNIDEDAYDSLKKYLDEIRSCISLSTEADEILEDVEYRLAELFSKNLAEGRQSINMDDVQAAMTQMGHPSEFASEAGTENVSGKTATESEGLTDEKEFVNTSASKAKRKFFRDPNDRVFAGICSGLSQYLGIQDPIWARLFFVILLIGSLFIWITPVFIWIVPIYILLWFIVPEAQNASDFLQMRGEPITLEGIRRKRDELKLQPKGSGTRKAANQFADVLMQLLKVFAKVVVYGTAVMLVIIGFFVFAASVIAGFLFLFTIIPGMKDVVSLIADSNWHFSMWILGLMLIAAIPALAMLFLGVKIFKNNAFNSARLWFTMLGVFVLGAILTSIFTLQLIKPFTETEERVENLNLPLSSDTLILTSENLIGDDNININTFGEAAELFEVDGRWAIPNAEVEIQKSTNGSWMLRKEISASGRNGKEAKDNLKSVRYDHKLNGDTLFLPDYLSFEKESKYRNQNVHLVLQMPVGATIFLSKSSGDVIYDIDNVTHTYDDDMLGYYWQMTENGLQCTDSAFNAAGTLIKGESIQIDSFSSSRRFDLRDFNSVETDGEMRLIVRQGQDYGLIVGGDGGRVDDVKVRMSGSKLLISDAKKVTDGQHERLTVIVSLPVINAVRLNGATDCELGHLNADNLSIQVDGAAKVSGEVVAANLQVHADGASYVSLQGECKNLVAELNGAGALSSLNLKAESVKLKTAGACAAEVWAVQELDVTMEGAGVLKYKGDPAKKRIDHAGISKVEQIK